MKNLTSIITEKNMYENIKENIKDIEVENSTAELSALARSSLYDIIKII